MRLWKKKHIRDIKCVSNDCFKEKKITSWIRNWRLTMNLHLHLWIYNTPELVHRRHLSTKETESFETSHNGATPFSKVKKGKASWRKTENSSSLFVDSMGFMNILLCVCLRAVRPTCVSHCHLPFWSQTGKQSSNHCSVWWGLSFQEPPELY